MPVSMASSWLSPELPKNDVAQTPWPRIAWGLILLIVIAALLVSYGLPLGWVAILVGAVAILVAWRFPLPIFYLMIATAPFIGWMVTLSTGQSQFGARAFGGAIDVNVGEIVAVILLIAWAMRLLSDWHRGKQDWKPWLPLAFSFGLLVVAHLASMFSWAAPDKLQVLKYSLRPVLWVYLTSVVLPVNFIRTRKTLMICLAVLTTVGFFFGLDALRSLYLAPGETFQRLHPMLIYGVYPLGENHNVLAEFLLFTAPAALALAVLLKNRRERQLLWAMSGFMTMVALLTFARSAWLAAAVMGGFLALTVWRTQLRKHMRALFLAVIVVLPLLLAMFFFSSSSIVQSSTEARTMLTGIAWSLFVNSPVIGVGAGTFVDRVGATYAYKLDFGGPMDSHGVLQKLLAETGLLGLLAFSLVVWSIISYGWHAWSELADGERAERQAFLILAAATGGAFIYQLFNTTYWTPKLWLPVGIFLAAARLFASREPERDPHFLSH